MIERLFKAGLIGAVAVLVLMIPFIGLLVGIPLALVCMATGNLLKSYCESGEYVEIGFAWVTVHSTHVYFVYWAIFTVVVFLPMLLFGALGSRSEMGSKQ